MNGHFSKLLYALERSGISFDVTEAGASEATVDEAYKGLGEALARCLMPPVFSDILDYCYHAALLQRLELRQITDDLPRLTPFLRCPFRKMQASAPIHYVFSGRVADPTTLSPAQTAYAVIRDADDAAQAHLVPIVDARCFDLLASDCSLEHILAASVEPTRCISWINELAERRFVQWTLPKYEFRSAR